MAICTGVDLGNFTREQAVSQLLDAVREIRHRIRTTGFDQIGTLSNRCAYFAHRLALPDPPVDLIEYRRGIALDQFGYVASRCTSNGMSHRRALPTPFDAGYEKLTEGTLLAQGFRFNTPYGDTPQPTFIHIATRTDDGRASIVQIHEQAAIDTFATQAVDTLTAWERYIVDVLDGLPKEDERGEIHITIEPNVDRNVGDHVNESRKAGYSPSDLRKEFDNMGSDKLRDTAFEAGVLALPKRGQKNFRYPLEDALKIADQLISDDKTESRFVEAAQNFKRRNRIKARK